MPPTSPAANAAARRLLSAASAPPASGDARDPVAAADRVSADLADALARWFGPYGYHALLTRALAEARAEHPVLESVRIRTPLLPGLDGLADAAQTHGAAAVADGVVGLLAAVIDLLGRMIGEDMALPLVERSMEAPVPKVPDEPKRASAPTGEGAP